MVRSLLALILTVSLIAGCSSNNSKTSTDVVTTAPDSSTTRSDATGTADTHDVNVTPEKCSDGRPCDDQNPCTHSDKCDAEGECKGVSYTCDDGRACTDATCDGLGFCEYTIKKDKCFINGICHDKGKVNSKNPCLECAPAESTTKWSADDSNSCTEDNICTSNEVCRSGRCVFDSKDCDDKNPCTVNSCDPKKGCETTIRTGPCEDGDLCNGTELCDNKGKCQPATSATNCNDSNECTKDSCDPKIGCINKALDGGICTASNTFCEEDGKCTKFTDHCAKEGTCKEGACNFGGTKTGCFDDTDCKSSELCYHQICIPALLCDNGNTCAVQKCKKKSGCTTTNERPDGAECCNGTENPADDGNPCTIDICGENVGDYTYQANTGAQCDDGDPCTVNDSCKASNAKCKNGKCGNTSVGCTKNAHCKGLCQGTAINCNDNNDCTADSCTNGSCKNNPTSKVGQSCSGGLSCATSKKCTNAGLCLGNEDNCGCKPSFSPVVIRITSLAVAGATAGLDINGDGKGDNALSLVGAFANANIALSITNNQLVLLLEMLSYNTSNTPFTLALHTGSAVVPSCKDSNTTCQYRTLRSGYNDTTCAPKFALDNAKSKSGKLTAGGEGPQYSFELEIPLGAAPLTMPIDSAHIDATVTGTSNGITQISGKLAGAVNKAKLIAAIDSLDPSFFEDSPIGKDAIKGILGGFEADIDVDKNGTKESLSITLDFVGLKASITGVTN